MSSRDTLFLLKDMREAGEKIQRYTFGYDFEAFITDEKTVDAVIRNFEIIGEAASRIDSDFRNQNPEIEWRRIRGLRNRLIHEYFGVDHQVVWSIIEEYLPQLMQLLEGLINDN